MSAKQIGTVFYAQSSDLCRGPQTVIVLHEVADVDPLAAFGEAIAMVARAQMIARVGVGCAFAERVAERSVSLSVFGPSRSTQRFYATLSSVSASGVVILNNWAGDCFDDFAAEAVAALIEECER